MKNVYTIATKPYYSKKKDKKMGCDYKESL